MTPAEFQKAFITISKEKLAAFPIAEYKGEIILVDHLSKLPAAIEVLSKSEIIGFDTETRPSFKRGQHYDLSLIQLATPDKCFLFRTNEIGYPRELIEILENPDLLKVGLSIHDDFHNLRKVVDIEPRGFIDLQHFVKEYKITDNSLAKIYGLLFEERISKGQRLSNWEAEELSESQKIYAALDAYACIKIYQFLKSGCFDPKNSPYLTLPVENDPAQDESVPCGKE